MPWLRVNGRYVDATIGRVGELEWSHHNGPLAASWVMDLPPKRLHEWMPVDALVEITAARKILWSGHLDEPKPPEARGQAWEFTASGKRRLAERFLALDSAGNATATPQTAVDEAIGTYDLAWVAGTLGPNSTTPLTAGTTGVNFLDKLLDAYALEQGMRWGVTPDGVYFMEAEPAAPTLYATPGVGTVGIVDRGFGATLVGRYLSTSTAYATVFYTDAATLARFGPSQTPVDLTAYGPMSSTRATDMLEAMAAQGATRPASANGLVLSASQLRTPGGAPVCLPLVGLGLEKLRLPGVRDPYTGRRGYHDVPIGEVRYRNGASVIELIPSDVESNNLLSALTGTGGIEPKFTGHINDSGMQSYNPTWQSTGTAPGLSNGTLTGAWMVHDGITHVRIALTIGSTSTDGTGNYRITLPSTPSSYSLMNLGSAFYFDSSAGAGYSGAAFYDGAGVAATFAATRWSATGPVAPDVGDVISFVLTYV